MLAYLCLALSTCTGSSPLQVWVCLPLQRGTSGRPERTEPHRAGQDHTLVGGLRTGPRHNWGTHKGEECREGERGEGLIEPPRHFSHACTGREGGREGGKTEEREGRERRGPSLTVSLRCESEQSPAATAREGQRVSAGPRKTRRAGDHLQHSLPSSLQPSHPPHSPTYTHSEPAHLK